MEKFEEIFEFAKNTLSEKRFYHSVCVMERAIEYAKIYGADTEKAKIAGILHDIAKEIPKEDRVSYAENIGVIPDEIEKESTGLLHSKVAAKIAETKFGLDKEICDSIAYHTTGRENMTLLDKIIYIADYTGKDRKYEDTNYMYELAKKDIDAAIIYGLKKTIDLRIKEDKLLHIDTVKAYNFLIKDL